MAGAGRRPSASAGTTRRWLGGIRFSAFSLIMMGVLVLAVVVLAPTTAAFVTQRQQIAALHAEVEAQKTELARLAAERERWNDSTFIMAQARERLYYVMPGEVSYLVIDDRAPGAVDGAAARVSADVVESRGDWLGTMLTSVMVAGLAPAPGDEPEDGR